MLKFYRHILINKDRKRGILGGRLFGQQRESSIGEWMRRTSSVDQSGELMLLLFWVIRIIITTTNKLYFHSQS